MNKVSIVITPLWIHCSVLSMTWWRDSYLENFLMVIWTNEGRKLSISLFRLNSGFATLYLLERKLYTSTVKILRDTFFRHFYLIYTQFLEFLHIYSLRTNFRHAVFQSKCLKLQFRQKWLNFSYMCMNFRRVLHPHAKVLELHAKTPKLSHMKLQTFCLKLEFVT